MEKNTVVLSLNEYNLMRDQLSAIETNHTFYVRCSTFSSVSPITIVSKEDAIEKIAKANIALQKEAEEMKTYQHTLFTREVSAESREREINSELSKMSIWEFLKWRKKERN